jgi:hypothetical protein
MSALTKEHVKTIVRKNNFNIWLMLRTILKILY